MNPAMCAIGCLVLAVAGGFRAGAAAGVEPEAAGLAGRYRHEPQGALRPTVVREYVLTIGPTERVGEGPTLAQWRHLDAAKADGTRFQVWWLGTDAPGESRSVAAAAAVRYVVQEGAGEAVECIDRFSRRPVLPGVVAWRDLWPQGRGDAGLLPERATLLGHSYQRIARTNVPPTTAVPPAPRVVELLPDVWIGLPSNRRQKDERRRYDGSEYEYIRLEREDYREMVASGMTCLRVEGDQLPWVEGLDAFYWGVGPETLPFPECLYRSQYLGPTLFLDEPAVGTRDHVLRPRLAREPGFRRDLTVATALEAFRQHFDEVLRGGAPQALAHRLRERPEVDLGAMNLRQQNLYSWETMVATAVHQLSQDPEVPDAMVFEPPGRVGTRRTLPEMNLTYGCQIPADNPANLTAILYGFLRGAARLTGKTWGTSIYGAVDATDAPWFLARAYDLGATRFFFWDNAALACVPFHECLTLARGLRAHVESRPRRDLARLRQAAEIAILLPPGYNLGHVHLGKGNLWGLPELNLERLNAAGVPYRRVMSAFFTEIERCLRLGIAFDLLWDLPGLAPTGYGEIVRVRESGEVEVATVAAGGPLVLPGPRTPPRPGGQPPLLKVAVSSARGPAPRSVTARAEVVETSAPVYYTLGADRVGEYRNAAVAWEVYGPNPEDHRFLGSAALPPPVVSRGDRHEATVEFTLPQPGRYRLRAATTDLAGRSTVVWTDLTVEE